MTTTILAWAFIFAVPLFAFVYAWFVMEDRRGAWGSSERAPIRGWSLTLLFTVFLAFGIWLLNLPA